MPPAPSSSRRAFLPCLRRSKKTLRVYSLLKRYYRDLIGPNAERLFPLPDAQGKDAPSVYRAGCLYPLTAGHRHPECVPTKPRKTSSRQKHENRRFIAPSGNNDFREKGILQRPHLRFAPLRCNVGARCRVPAILPLRHFAPTILRRESGRFAGFLSGGWGRPRSSPPPSPRAPFPLLPLARWRSPPVGAVSLRRGVRVFARFPRCATLAGPPLRRSAPLPPPPPNAVFAALRVLLWGLLPPTPPSEAPRA